MTETRDIYSITTDKLKLDIDFIHRFLTQSYWADRISKEIVAKSIEGSLCFGVFDGDRQIGFARMVTDNATFAYLADVFIEKNYRGKGLSKWLMQIIMSHPDLQGLRRILLATRDAHGLYSQFGFTPLNNPERWMQIHNPDVYKK
ncbi:MAG: GNAT family N-acetyltransferase [Sphingobacteriales bacterium]|nr:GNAT family N-acetyltransferase [Sphingobacteriales bacterium]